VVDVLTPIVFLDHLNVGVFRQTLFADGGKVGGLPARPIKILLDLGRHCEIQQLCAGSFAECLSVLVDRGLRGVVKKVDAKMSE